VGGFFFGLAVHPRLLEGGKSTDIPCDDAIDLDVLLRDDTPALLDA
jgi:hypothetical protein